MCPNDNYIIMTEYTVIEFLKYGLTFFSPTKLLEIKCGWPVEYFGRPDHPVAELPGPRPFVVSGASKSPEGKTTFSY